ncbi:type IV toxin-antitoxin system AbiEi family antitoxin domain-containing protein [Pseudarthrobacter chlorophenolicus]|uniref:type IV toxin-antitoxin system AbiEi family antitoxin domain-containing protein n=1 Tax=Pseudarthrobacter chlorophenolicus TaxID=85085 RepID=UPI0005F287D7|nr:type IV toxin-antitoxin system AbiEi family antitoxin domain-containing protein [Pseudarthrobacter chlorophenolicus]
MEIPPGLIDTAAILRTGATTDSLHRAFRAGQLVRIRRGFYVPTEDWLRARPSERFAWTTTAVARSVKGAVLCGQTAAVASGLPTLGTPPCVEVATALPGRSGTRASTLLVLGESGAAEEVRRTRSYPLRYRLGAVPEPVRSGEFVCSGLIRTAVDVLGSAELDQALVVADGAARTLRGAGILGPGATLLSVPGIAAGIAELPSAAGRRRAERVAALASPLPESVGESYSRAVVEFLGFEQPVLQQVFSDGAGFIGRSDFWWPRQGVVGEFDGKAKYVEAAQRDAITAEEAVYREKLREDRIRALGHGFVRWRWADLADPSKLQRKLLAAGLRPGVGMPAAVGHRLVRRSKP